MAWFYNLFLTCFSRIGLVASLCRHHGPAAIAVHKFTFFLKEFANFKKSRAAKTSKTAFLNGLLYQANFVVFWHGEETIWSVLELPASSCFCLSFAGPACCALAACPQW
jgi:hypothetical protein